MKQVARPSAHGARRAWLLLLLLLLLLGLGVAAQDQLADAGHQLHAWYVG